MILYFKLVISRLNQGHKFIRLWLLRVPCINKVFIIIIIIIINIIIIIIIINAVSVDFLETICHHEFFQSNSLGIFALNFLLADFLAYFSFIVDYFFNASNLS